ncbi:alpha/beta hydrolase [Spirochaeta dissipatitropha]
MTKQLKVYARDLADCDIHCFLLHGFGADAHDLMSLSNEMHTSAVVDYLYPQAPYEIVMNGMKNGTAWFPRNEPEIMKALTGDYFLGLSRIDPPDMKLSADELLAFIEDTGMDWSKIILGGFSQGAMIAVETALRAPKPPAGLMILSGALVARERWAALASELPSRWGKDIQVPVYQSHGRQDAILDIVGAEELQELLSESGVFCGELAYFSGPHTIPFEILKDIAAFIDETANRVKD